MSNEDYIVQNQKQIASKAVNLRYNEIKRKTYDTFEMELSFFFSLSLQNPMRITLFGFILCNLNIWIGKLKHVIMAKLNSERSNVAHSQANSVKNVYV